ncbi:DUF6461 domain-containing protein [Lentzea sp.]|uniref:DUF6461 domain-containing protein n=1 Tax=Lentzea sp. TaxID=56099 RepID=UPI002BA3A9F7|nr:DUF6461 domain-containing protein [Lentzea sp.]HUQ57790.1 DUF6461 domain-containing protein [Lentzea sp.]
MNTPKTVLNAGEYLFGQSLVSPNGAYALENRADGALVLRDNLASRDLWQIGEGGSERVLLDLLTEGLLVLRTFSGIPLWSSGRIDRRASAALVRDDGRLVLVDADGNQRWSRDPADAAVLACSPPARGDRLSRGEVLVGSIVSPNGWYELSQTPNGRCVLRSTPESPGGARGVWSCWIGAPGAVLSLAQDGVLRAGTDSTVLQRWTGRMRLDPSSVVVSEVVVRDVGDVVLVGEDGSEIDVTGTAAEEARLAENDDEFDLREAEQSTRPPRPAGSGMTTDWFDSLDLSVFFTITWVQGIDGREALSRLGVEAEAITPMTYDEAVSTDSSDHDGMVSRALAVPVGGWVAVIEPHGFQGVYRASEMSAGTQVIVYHQGMDGTHLAWHRNGERLAVYSEDDYFELADGKPAPEGLDPSAFVPFMAQVGLGVYRDEDEEESEFLPPPLEVACLAAGVVPEPEHFAGTHPGAISAEL